MPVGTNSGVADHVSRPGRVGPEQAHDADGKEQMLSPRHAVAINAGGAHRIILTTPSGIASNDISTRPRILAVVSHKNMDAALAGTVESRRDQQRVGLRQSIPVSILCKRHGGEKLRAHMPRTEF